MKISLIILYGLLLVLLMSVICLPFIRFDYESHPVCIVGAHGECVKDITAEYTNQSIDPNRECNQNDRYSLYSKYICINHTDPTDFEGYTLRGADRTASTYTYLFIYNSSEIPELKSNRTYAATFLIQDGYCLGPGKLVNVIDLGVECHGGDTCHGYSVGWTGEHGKEICEG